MERRARRGTTEPGWGLGQTGGERRPVTCGTGWRAAGWAVLIGLLIQGPVAWAEALQREPVTLRVVAVNPSAEKKQVVPVKIDLPQEVTPAHVRDKGELELEFDDDRSIYYVYKNDVELAPKETKVFQVVVDDLWFIPDEQLASMQDYTTSLLQRIAKSEYREAGNKLGQSILQRLDEILAVQNDESLSRKSRIGAYRRHLQTMAEIKDDLGRLEKLLQFAGGPPVPDMLEESPLKSDAPSTTTTWLVIFLILVFMGLLAGQFFFTWQRRVKASTDFVREQQATFAGPGMSQEPADAASRPGDKV